LKSDELGFGGGFLSGLGFSKHEEKTVEPEQDEDDLALHNIQIPVVSSEEVSQERISFSQPTQRYEARKISSAPEQPKEKKEFPAKKQHGNISIGQGTYKPKEKVIATAADFARFQTEKAPEKKSDFSESVAKKHHTSQPEKRVEKKPENKPVVPKVHKEATTSANLVKKTEVTIDENITVKEFSEKI
jgi:hypothetical protein